MDRPPAPDVAVIGGGIIGTSAAAYVASLGARVTLYERSTIAAGASGRNSGVVQRPYDPVLEPLYGRTVELYRDLEASVSGFRLPPEPAGLLFVSLDPDRITATARALSAAAPGSEVEVLDPAAVRKLEPALGPEVRAVRLPIGYPVPPAMATQAFGELARRLGVTIREATPAVPAIAGGAIDGVRSGADGRLEPAGAVLVAAGPWSPSLVDPSGAWLPIRPIWGVVVEVSLTTPPSHVLEEAGIVEPDSGGGSPDDDVEFSLVTAAGRSGLGSTFLEAEPDLDRLVPALVRHGLPFLPELATAPVLGSRACARPVSADGVPLVGRVPGVAGLWIAAGHGPWGISTGPATAGMVAEAILGAPDALPAVLDPGRFGELPLA